ncbi:MAG: DUF3570 domain-containing protein [Bacteroidia bacterium]|nr:DUF3570 domain-containing protein [Bacteroidia bacterium]
MQLIIVSLALFILVLTQDLKAQVKKRPGHTQATPVPGDSTKQELVDYATPGWNTVKADFLSSYYAQDGNNSPVTGGIGTEQLTDFTQKVILTIPLKPRLTLNLDGGYDYYTSASTGMIDNIRSGESSEDIRVHGNVGLTYKLKPKESLGFRVGGSTEYDYNSFQFGMNYQKLSKDENTSLSLSAQAFIDQWSLIYPKELRHSGQLLPTNQRQSFNGSLTLTRVLDKKTQVAFQIEGILMNGLLSTPFHRVFFQEQAAAKVEFLPSTRFKVPVGIRLNRYVNDWLVARLSYRFYVDDWGIMAHTASLELPVKVTRFFTLTPGYRFHTQTAAKYFQPYGVHSIQDQYYTSDYDLSALTSHSVGLGVDYQPPGGIFRVKIPQTDHKYIKLRNVSLKYSHYLRSTGLKADIISFGIGFDL